MATGNSSGDSPFSPLKTPQETRQVSPPKADVPRAVGSFLATLALSLLVGGSLFVLVVASLVIAVLIYCG